MFNIRKKRNFLQRIIERFSRKNNNNNEIKNIDKKMSLEQMVLAKAFYEMQLHQERLEHILKKYK